MASAVDQGVTGANNTLAGKPPGMSVRAWRRKVAKNSASLANQAKKTDQATRPFQSTKETASVSQTINNQVAKLVSGSEGKGQGDSIYGFLSRGISFLSKTERDLVSKFMQQLTEKVVEAETVKKLAEMEYRVLKDDTTPIHAEYRKERLDETCDELIKRLNNSENAEQISPLDFAARKVKTIAVLDSAFSKLEGNTKSVKDSEKGVQSVKNIQNKTMKQRQQDLTTVKRRIETYWTYLLDRSSEAESHLNWFRDAINGNFQGPFHPYPTADYRSKFTQTALDAAQAARTKAEEKSIRA